MISYTPFFNWIKDYLSNRQQKVTMGVLLAASQVMSGVPQGSVLGPLLFLLYIMTYRQKYPLPFGSMHADNVIIYRPIVSTEDVLLLQQDLEILAQWVKMRASTHNKQTFTYLI